MKSLVLFLTLNPLQLQGDTHPLLPPPPAICLSHLCVFAHLSLCNSIWQCFCLSFPERRDDKGCFSSGLLCPFLHFPLFSLFNFYFPPSI